MSPSVENDVVVVRHMDAYVRANGTGYFYDCPRCHFFKNRKEGPCRMVRCDGTVVRVEFRVIPPEEGNA